MKDPVDQRRAALTKGQHPSYSPSCLVVKAEKAKVLQAYISRSYHFTLAEPAPVSAPSATHNFGFSANIEGSNPISSCPITSRPARRLANPTLQEDGFQLVEHKKKRSRVTSPV